MPFVERGQAAGRALTSVVVAFTGRLGGAVARLRARPPEWLTVAAFTAAAVGVVQFYDAPSRRDHRPFAQLDAGIGAAASRNAFGTSGAVRLRFALPGHDVEFPLQVGSDPRALGYQWVPVSDNVPVDSARPLGGASIVAPAEAGFYRLALVRGAAREIMPSPLLAVMVPFADKIGGTLNGYHIGTYLAERFTRRRTRPAPAPPTGFLEVDQAAAELPVSAHFHLRDFLTHDTQSDVWPKYVALNPRLLDKLELVVAKLAQYRVQAGVGNPADLPLDVHSGFRTPLHNERVHRAASDSRHQYGDAADVAIDVDGCGRVTMKDELLVARAVDEVEAEHPELVGGLGLYVSRRYRTPYVHIDARGTRTRWRG